MDVEGYEEHVLLGAKTVLGKESLRAIQAETVTTNSREILHKYGFAEAFFDPFKRVLSREPVGLKPSNELFIRDFAFVNNRIACSDPIRALNSVL
jgi:hypothetical protein